MMPESELQAARARIVEALRANGDMTGQQLRDALSMPEPQPGYGLGLLGPSYVVGGYDPFTPLLQQLFRLPDSPA